jgi:hypothetical protein
MKRWERLFLFACAVSILSLGQFHLDWYDIFRDHSKNLTFLDSILEVMKAGPLFFFAAPLSVATFFEVHDNRSLSRNTCACLLSYACAFPVLALVFECFRVRYGAAQPDTVYLSVQGSSAIFAIVVAVIIKFIVYKSPAGPRGTSPWT